MPSQESKTGTSDGTSAIKEFVKEASIRDLPRVCCDLFMPWNTTCYWLAIAISLSGVMAHSWLWLMLLPALFVGNELCTYFILDYNFLSTDEVVWMGYNFSRWLDGGSAIESGLDYGFNFYDGDYKKSRSQAQTDKFEFAFQKLGLKSGMSLLDCGCGCGDWIQWLKEEKGVTVHGINITGAQVQICRDRGLEVEHVDWKEVKNSPELQAKLYGKFDCVSFWDTVEHYVPSHYRRKPELKMRVYQDMFAMAKELLKPSSPCRGIWISCLHIRNSLDSTAAWSWKQLVHRMFYYWLLDKYHSGCYPGAAKDDLVNNAAAAGIKLVGRKDTTLDYFMTSHLNPSHFGKHAFKVTPMRLTLFAVLAAMDPNWLARVMWHARENWMDQFDPNDLSKSDMQHWWLWFTVPHSKSAAA